MDRNRVTRTVRHIRGYFSMASASLCLSAATVLKNVQRSQRLHRRARQAPRAGADRRRGEPDLEIARGHRSGVQVAGRRPGAAVRAADRVRHAGRGQSVRLDEAHVHGARRRTLDDLGAEIDELATPKMPSGMLDALKLLPMVNRLRDLMPKTVKDGSVPGSRPPRRHARRHAHPQVLAGGRRTLHHVPAGLHQGPRDRHAQHRHLSHAGVRRRSTGMHWQRHKGGAQHHRVAERLGKRMPVAVALSPDPALAYSATAPMPEGLDELMLGWFLRRERSSSSSASPSISRSRRTRRSCSRATSSRVSGGAKGRSATTRASIRTPTTSRCFT